MTTYIYYFRGVEEVAAVAKPGTVAPNEMTEYAKQNNINFNIGLYFVEDPEGQPIDQGAFYKEA